MENLTDLQKLALEHKAINAVLPREITRRTLRSLVNKGLLTEDVAGEFWITEAGRQAIETQTEIDLETPAENQTEAPVAKKTAKGRTPQDCRCSCGKKTSGGNYAQGHDAKHVSQVVKKLLAEGVSLKEAQDTIEITFWDSPRLEVKAQNAFARKFGK